MKRLILLGGGHAHVNVLADIATRPLADREVHLVTPYRRQIYSGMLPGWIAGTYAIDACTIALDRMAARSAVIFHETSGIGLDPARKILRCADGTTMDFDLLSIDTGPVPATDALPGSAEHALPIRPIERFVASWPELAERIRSTCGRFELAILGGGAAGVELAFAIRRRALIEVWSGLRVSVLGADRLPLEGASGSVRRRIAALLAQRGIAWHAQRRATRIDSGRIVFDNAPPFDFDACVVATGAAAPAWPAASGLETDARGFIRVGPTLQSVSYPYIFAAGDAAAYHDARPKSGVYAVRAGPVLAANLRAVCLGRTPRAWRPQARALYLIATGNDDALASWGRWSAGGRWAWKWKDWIDRRFMRRFRAAA